MVSHASFWCIFQFERAVLSTPSVDGRPLRFRRCFSFSFSCYVVIRVQDLPIWAALCVWHIIDFMYTSLTVFQLHDSAPNDRKPTVFLFGHTHIFSILISNFVDKHNFPRFRIGTSNVVWTGYLGQLIRRLDVDLTCHWMIVRMARQTLCPHWSCMFRRGSTWPSSGVPLPQVFLNVVSVAYPMWSCRNYSLFFPMFSTSFNSTNLIVISLRHPSGQLVISLHPGLRPFFASLLPAPSTIPRLLPFQSAHTLDTTPTYIYHICLCICLFPYSYL